MYLGLVLTAVIVVMILRFADRLNWYQRQFESKLRAAPRATIAALPEGTTARLVGVMTSDATMRAPLTGRPCVAYFARVEEYANKRWRDRFTEVRGVPFTIDDGTGRALIDPTRSELLLEMDSTTRSGALDDATPVEDSFLHRHGFSSRGVFFNKQLRYTEGVIEPGERVAVVGRGVREPDPDGAAATTGYRSALPTRLSLSGSADHPIIITDRDDLVAIA